MQESDECVYHDLAVIGDCFLVVIEDIPSLFPNERPNLNVIRGLGFFFYEDLHGHCSWNSAELYKEYQGNLGKDWRTPRGMAIGASACAYSALVVLFSMSCCNFQRIPRTILGVFILCILPFFQALVYTVVQTDLCRDFGCKLGRTAISNGVATGCFILSGIAVFCTRDYDKDRDPLWCKSPQAETAKETPMEEMSILENEEECGLSKESLSPSRLRRRRLFGEESPNTSTDDVEEQPARPESSRQYLTKIAESEDENDVETTIFPQDKDLEFHDDSDDKELFPSPSPAISPVYTFHDGEDELDDPYPFPSDSGLQQQHEMGDIEVLLGGSIRSDSELESLDGSDRSPRTPPQRRRKRRKARS